MEKFKAGIINFSAEDFLEHKELFSRLKDSQNPHTLFIGCSDSRVVPNMITKTLPGELFMVRNIANLVPPYRETEEFVSTTSAIEYAVEVLNVENIVVCGHSNCGGCAAIHKDEKEMAHIPHVKKWLELATSVKAKIEKETSNPDDKQMIAWMTEQANIVEQIKHLFTYPFIVDRYIRGKLNIYGWYYIIETGEVYNYNKETGYFELVK